ncbi:MAG: glutamate--tRNA ligase [Candidatus Nanoarchaeia archaeon]|nr:glutamate--tRNA ligase [Candidatus Nanoarchaeia archaeon]
MRELILKYALQNALKYNGKASENAVLGKIFGENKDLNKQDIMKIISEVLEEVNSMKVEEQKLMLEKLAPELLEKKEKKERNIFEFLNIRDNEKIITAFPPGPEKYPHIGHAKSLILNYELAKKYGGKFYLRFEDTNPILVKKEFYDIMLDNFKWLNVKWDKLIYASDYMELYYKKAEEVIKKNKAYMCKCSNETMSEYRSKGKECKCRDNSIEENLRLWKEFFKAEKGSMVLRLKIDMEHKNTTMRDPTVFRIIEEEHARHGKKYRVWPNYDFENAIMDGYFKITHRLRSKEFELRSELQRYIQKLLGYELTHTYEFGRLNIKGVPASGRIIREKIDKKELTGWDDPRLTTLVALRKRGFLPEAIREFVLSTGVSKSEATMTWDDLIVKNKKLLDFESDRYIFVSDKAKKIKIKNCPKLKAKIPLHPDDEKRGSNLIETEGEFLVEDKLEKNKVYRFMHLFNFVDLNFISEEYDPTLKATLIHWLPTKDLVNIQIVMNDSKIMKGFCHKSINNVKVNRIVQFERFGFCRKDSKDLFYFTHK